jgi:hypothetical protein
MEKIRIICTSPGLRRAGKEHPARAVYDRKDWTDEQLQQIAKDPAFTVLPIDGDGVLSEDTVPKDVFLKLEADLQAANDKIADLEEQLAAAKKPAAKKAATPKPDAATE